MDRLFIVTIFKLKKDDILNRIKTNEVDLFYKCPELYESRVLGS